MFNFNINVMNIDLFKYIMKLSIIPIMFISLFLITYGDDSDINVVNIIGYILLVISSIVIYNDAKNKDE